MAGKISVLRGAHVIDKARGVDGLEDVIVQDGKIRGPGAIPDDAEILDLTGRYLSPGWIDMHVHAYGALGFADVDSIGIAQGVTSFCEAGGPGIATIDEYFAFFDRQTTTSLYAGVYLAPMGIVGIGHIEGDVRSISDIPVVRWIDKVAEHRDLVRYLKFGAFSSYGTGPLKMGKGLAEILDLPIYCHIGEFQQLPGRPSAYEIYNIAGEGDMVTHIYHGNEIGILDENRKVLPLVRDAAARGVLFDVGFGGSNFAWDVAEAAVDQQFLPHTISSDLQQFNVAGPVYSLANVMSVFLKLGFSVSEVVSRVTDAPARALKLDQRAGTLRPGMPADLTVFRVEDCEVVLTDTQGAERVGNRRFVPEFALKNGIRVNSDLLLCQDERNWILEIATEGPPSAAKSLTARQRGFLDRLAQRLDHVAWNDKPAAELDLDVALELTGIFQKVCAETEIAIRPAVSAVLDSLLSSSFRMPVGVLLVRAGRDLSLTRFRQVVNG